MPNRFRGSRTQSSRDELAGKRDCKWSPTGRGLREQLEEIADRYGADRVAEQIPRIAELKGRFPPSISLLQAAIPDKPEAFQFNCYQHSFGLARAENVTPNTKEYWHVFPGREFVQFLLNARLEEIRADNARDGDHVIYAGLEIEHAGFVWGERIDSKWGLGHLWRHGVYDVPLGYGNHVRYFPRLTSETCVGAFLEYAGERGVCGVRSVKQRVQISLLLERWKMPDLVAILIRQPIPCIRVFGDDESDR